MAKKAIDSDKAKDYYATYAEYNRALRAWFVAFGVGGPVVFLVNEDLGTKLANEGVLQTVAIFFLVGAAAQILVALINKICIWCQYYGEANQAFKETCRYRAAQSVGKQFWIDVLLDVVSIVAFAVAILIVFAAFK